MFEDTEINDEFIREYLSNQLTYYSEPFVEKKARSEVQNEDIGCNNDDVHCRGVQ